MAGPLLVSQSLTKKTPIAVTFTVQSPNGSVSLNPAPPQDPLSASIGSEGQLFFSRFEKIFSLKLTESFSFIKIFGLKLFRSQVIWRFA